MPTMLRQRRRSQPRDVAPALDWPPVSAAEAAVTLSGVQLTRRLGRNQAFTLGIDQLELKAGTATAVIGCNGCGKTTLLNIIAGVERPQRGTVARRPGVEVAYLTQQRPTHDWLPLTVREVVTMGRYSRRGAVRRMRTEDRATIENAAEQVSVDGMMGRQFNDLSGGERQRVLLAQCLAQEPDVMLMDEPITGLDLPNQKVILDLMDNLCEKGTSFVVSTHQLIEANHADRVLVLSEGKIVDDGQTNEVLWPDRLQHKLGIGPDGAPDSLYAILQGGRRRGSTNHEPHRPPDHHRPHAPRGASWQR